MGSESIIIEITYSTKDLRPFLIGTKKGTIALTVVYIFVVLFIAYVAASHVITNEISESFRLGALAYLISAPLLTVVINLVAYERIVRKKAAARKEPITIEITETGITSTEKYKTAALEWGAYNMAVEYKDKFVIYSGTGGLLIPKRCFSSEESLRSFRDLLERCLSGKIINK